MAKKPTKKSTKKSAAKKSKAKTVKKAKSPAKKTAKAEATVVPTYLQPGATFELGLHDVIRALKLIEKHGHLGKFVSQLKKERRSVTVPADTVNFVKDFFVKTKMHKDAVGRHIVNAPTVAPENAGLELAKAGPVGASSGDRFKCNFGNQ